MAKELGQIHTVNVSAQASASGDAITVDLPGELSEQLQRNIRWGQFFKCVGIDMSLDTVGTIGGGQVTGSIRYFAPTRGRCDAVRASFKAMKDVMKIQGISMSDNKLYDFRAPMTNTAGFRNRATLDGTNGLALSNAANPGASIFGVHNESQRPTYTGTAGDLFTAGFDTVVQTSGGTDFVLNDTVMFTGDSNVASEELESIPFMMSWTPDSTDLAVQFSWKPDPALYLAVLAGQFQVYVEEINLDGTPTAPALNINISVHVSGWKSIMGDPSKRKRRSTSKKSSARMTKTTTTVVKK